MSNQAQDPRILIESMPDGDTKTLGNILLAMNINMDNGFASLRNEIAQTAKQTEQQILEVKTELEAEMTNRSCNEFWSRHDEYEAAKQILFFDEPKSTGSAERDMKVLRTVAKKRIDELIGEYADDVGYKDFWMEFVVRYHQKSRPSRSSSKSGVEYDTIKVFFVSKDDVEKIASAGRRNKIDGWRINQTITESKMFKLAKTAVDRMNADETHNAIYKVKNYRPVFKEYKKNVPDSRRKYEQPPSNFMPDPLCWMPSQRKDTHVGIRASIPDASNNFHPGQAAPSRPRFVHHFPSSGITASNFNNPGQVRQPFPGGNLRIVGSSGHGGYVHQMTAAEMAAGAPGLNGSVIYLSSQPEQIPQAPTYYTHPGTNPQSSNYTAPTAPPSHVPGPSGTNSRPKPFQYSNYTTNSNNTNTKISASNSIPDQNIPPNPQPSADHSQHFPPNCKIGKENDLFLNLNITRRISKKIKLLRRHRKTRKKRKKQNDEIDTNIPVFSFADSDEQLETETETETSKADNDNDNRKRKQRTYYKDSSTEKQPSKKSSLLLTTTDDGESGSDDAPDDDGDGDDEYEEKLIQLIREHAKYDSNKRRWQFIGFDEESSDYAPLVQREILNKIDELAKLKDTTSEYNLKRNKNLAIQITNDVKLLAYLERGQSVSIQTTTVDILPDLTKTVVNDIKQRYKVDGVEQLTKSLSKIFLKQKNPPTFDMFLSRPSVKMANLYGTKPSTTKMKKKTK